MGFDIAAIRLHNQQLAGSRFLSPSALVSHFGAMQAQDYPMSKWAIGLRMAGGVLEAIVEKALNDGDIIRTHFLRPTWHLAAVEDIRWLLDLTSGNILRQFNSMNSKLGLDEKIFSKATDLIVRQLEGGQHLTREELVKMLKQNGVKTDQYRSLHILAHAELHAVICSGRRKGKHHSYALFDERVKKSGPRLREDALGELALRYFTSHGPATQRDFGWWSGLGVADCRVAIGLNSKTLVSKTHQNQVYYWQDLGEISSKTSALLLPAFDEFLISYKDRTASIDASHMPHAFTVNGIFKPVILLDGRVVGIWKRTLKKDKVVIDLAYLQDIGKANERKVARAAEGFGQFLATDVQVSASPR